MAKAPAHKWSFRARFRRHAYGWKSQPAIKRIKEAASEIKKVAKKDPLLAAEGAVSAEIESTGPRPIGASATSGGARRSGRRWAVHVGLPSPGSS